MLHDLIANGQSMRTVSLPRGRQRVHAMPTSSPPSMQESSLGFDVFSVLCVRSKCADAMLCDHRNCTVV